MTVENIEEITDDINKAEEELLYQDNYNEVPPDDIVAYNELRSCADLVRMYSTKQLVIKPDFQRDLVWNKPAQTRFIDSLIKQLPIPSMCISLDYKTGERLMIDGLQRISSIINFLTDEDWKLSQLEDIDSNISGKTVKQIKEKNKPIYTRLENLTIPVTILRCDYSKKKHMEYLFTIFHRLNTGGNKLNNQEIRNCIYHGKFNDLLKATTASDRFKKLFDIDDDKKYRFSNEELLLRFFAFHEKYESYNGKLSNFLNDFMSTYREPNNDFLSNKQNLVDRVIRLIFVRILNEGVFPKISKTTTEAILVGIARNIDLLENQGDEKIQAKFFNLRENVLFSVDSLKEGLAAKDKVITRLNKAVEIFSVP